MTIKAIRKGETARQAATVANVLRRVNLRRAWLLCWARHKAHYPEPIFMWSI
jgi:hypothetical protein